ncbi:putative orfan [Tupanvirus soda lake]|uniref:Orfan n=2 Tax=Tupanvirus TaxID=2094720 RepID=A0AC62AB75_9VIRU|nr:putative orfan [Tupanvirus soda lake]QKU34923.1 putative orfan [Tupanvirus soda lake]
MCEAYITSVYVLLKIEKICNRYQFCITLDKKNIMVGYLKYLGTFEPSTNEIIIDCAYLNKSISIEVPIKKWHVICSIDHYESDGVLYIHTDNFNVHDTKIKIDERYFRSKAIIYDRKCYSKLKQYLGKYIDEDVFFEKGYEINESKEFVLSSVPQGWWKGQICKFVNKENEITAIGIFF